MRKNQINGIINDFLDFRSYENPLGHIFLDNKFEINLITGEVDYPERDDVYDFFEHKRKWFIGTIKNLGGNIEDFGEAKLIIFGAKEKIRIKYKDELFESGKIYKNFGRGIFSSKTTK